MKVARPSQMFFWKICKIWKKSVNSVQSEKAENHTTLKNWNEGGQTLWNTFQLNLLNLKNLIKKLKNL